MKQWKPRGVQGIAYIYFKMVLTQTFECKDWPKKHSFYWGGQKHHTINCLIELNVIKVTKIDKLLREERKG